VEAGVELLVADLLALEVLREDIVVGLGGRLEELVSAQGDLVRHPLRDRDLDLRLAIEAPCLAVDEIDVALEGLAGADRDVERRDLRPEGRPEGVERPRRIGVLLVALVDEEAGRGVRRPPERDTLLIHAISQWAEVDPVTATAWAEAVPEVELRQRLVAATSVALANQNGAAAAKLAVNVLRPGEDQDRAVVAIVQRWAENSPRTAADWVAQFPDTSVQQLAVQNLVALWTAQDPIGPVNWLRGLPETSLRRAGWSAYGQAIQQQDRAILPGPSSTVPVSGPQNN
jgi:hypothetical protein